MISKQEWEEGQSHPVIKALKQWLDRKVRTEQDEWASGQYNKATMEQTALSNVAAVGRIQGFAETLALDYETFAGDMSEYIGTEAERNRGTSGALRAGDSEQGRDRDPESGEGSDAGG